jgi:hypothetical protein
VTAFHRREKLLLVTFDALSPVGAPHAVDPVVGVGLGDGVGELVEPVKVTVTEADFGE